MTGPKWSGPRTTLAQFIGLAILVAATLLTVAFE